MRLFVTKSRPQSLQETMQLKITKGLSFYTKMFILGGVLTLFGILKNSADSEALMVENETEILNRDSEVQFEMVSE